MKLAICRTDVTQQDISTYNSQEIGLAKAFARRGHWVDVIVANDSRSNDIDIRGLEGYSNIRIIRLPYILVPFIDEPFFKKFYSLIKNEKYDFVQINEEGNLASALTAIICTVSTTKFFIYQGMYKVLSGRRWAAYEMVNSKIFRPIIKKKAKKIFCKTSLAKKFLESKGYKNPIVCGVGLDMEKFDGRVESFWKDRLSVNESDKILLYVGSLEERRNPIFLISLAQMLDSDQLLVIVGDGPQKEEIDRLIKMNGVNNVRTLGKLPQSELPSLYEQSDAFLLPSNYEIYGMVVIEALSFGLPVVSSRTAGPIDILDAPWKGELVEELNEKKWRDAINSVIKEFGSGINRDRRRGFARSQYSWDRIVDLYISELSTISI